MTIDELRARQDEIKSRLRELDQEFAGQEFPPESRDEWERLEGEHETNASTLTELEFRQSRVEALGASPEHREEPASAPQTRRSGVARGEEIYDLSTVRSSVSGPEEATRELRERALRAIEREEPAHPDADAAAARTRMESLVRGDNAQGEVARMILATGSPSYRRGFLKTLAGQPCSPEELRALAIGGTAGLAVPFTLDPTVVGTSSGVVNPIRAIAEVKSITGKTWKGVTSGSVASGYVAEGTEAQDKAPTLAQPSIDAERAQTFVPYSIEAGGDWGALEAEMAKLIQEGKDELEAVKFLTGDGEDEPFGVLTGATNVTATATKEAFAKGDVYALKGLLPPRYRTNASWVANDAIYDRVRQFDTQGGADMWVRIGEGRPSELIGRPAYELSTMDSAVDGNEKKILMYGDFKRFVIVERLGMTVEVIPHLFGENGFPTGQRGLYAIWRNGSKLIDAAAIRVQKVKKE